MQTGYHDNSGLLVRLHGHDLAQNVSRVNSVYCVRGVLEVAKGLNTELRLVEYQCL